VNKTFDDMIISDLGVPHLNDDNTHVDQSGPNRYEVWTTNFQNSYLNTKTDMAVTKHSKIATWWSKYQAKIPKTTH